MGINVLILSQSGGSEGLGFAIPVDLVQTVVASLKSRGRGRAAGSAGLPGRRRMAKVRLSSR